MHIHRTSLAALAIGLGAGLVLALPVPAAADTSAAGAEGQTLTVSKSSGIATGGETVTVTGSGYDEAKGIYVAYCVDNGAGVLPSPCGGGADTSGSLGASHWISSNPPTYGEGLAVPYEAGGAFSVTLRITPTIGDIDCTARSCAVVTRADHTRTTDRSQDARIPISFAGSGGDPGGDPGGDNGDDNGDDNGGTGNGGEGSGDTGTGNLGSTDDDGANGGPTGPDGVSVITAGPVPEDPAEPVPDALTLTRLSQDDSAGRWWAIATGGLLAILLALWVVGRIDRYRRRRSADR